MSALLRPNRRRGREAAGKRENRRIAIWHRPIIAEAVVTQLVNKSTRADLRATKMLVDMLKDVEKKAGVTPPPEPAPFSAADEEVMATFIARLRQSWEEELRERDTASTGSPPQETESR